MTTTIRRIETDKPIDVKRLYLPFVIERECPECGETEEIDLNSRSYLNYPALDKPTEFPTYCDACNHEWTISLMLGVTLDVVEP